MSFIGLIVDSKNEKKMEAVMKKILEEKKYEIIPINENSLENIKNIKFETLFISINYKEKFKEIEIINKLLSKAKHLVINIDENLDFEIKNGIQLMLITYGFNLKCTVTASSVNDEEILVCIQRNIRDINEKIQEIQEIRIPRIEKLSDFDMIGISTMALLYGKLERMT